MATTINFYDTNFSFEERKILRKVTKESIPFELDFSGYNRDQKLGDNEAEIIRQILEENTVDRLSLRWNKITDIGAISIADSFRTQCTLKTLDLSNNEIDDAGIIMIVQTIMNLLADKGSISITNLYLQGNKFGADGVRALAALLLTKGAPPLIIFGIEHEPDKVEMVKNTIGTERALYFGGCNHLYGVYLKNDSGLIK